MTHSTLQLAREAQQLSRAKLAAKADVTTQTIYNLEHGTAPTLETARKVAGALGLPVDIIFPHTVSTDGSKAVNQ